MGSYFSKQRKPTDELEAIVVKLDQLNTRCASIQNSRYNFLWYLAVLAFFSASTVSAMVYASGSPKEPRVLYCILAWTRRSNGKPPPNPNKTMPNFPTANGKSPPRGQGDQAMPPPPAPLALEPQRGTLNNRAFYTPAIRRQPIRPFVQPNRTPIDKILDFIVGDGPANRFALICAGCKTHNGMALREEFESLSFLCFNCGLYNPARNAKNPLTPKRSITHQFPNAIEAPSAPLIRTATNSESSGEDSADDQEDENHERTEVVDA
ncbi:Endoplasmic reticulum junction formation protein lunapark [Aphelenchoides fujianensis]|nr:Endoplasmic reticulum junction formation protein lunapark [Aphelenchoides fujianensis]